MATTVTLYAPNEGADSDGPPRTMKVTVWIDGVPHDGEFSEETMAAARNEITTEVMPRA